MKVSLVTLGCRLNQAETALIGQRFEQRGWSVVAADEPADACVINSCTVTHEADAKTRQAVRQALRRNPDTFVAVVGCYAEVGADALQQIDGLDLIVGTAGKLDVANLIDEPAKRAVPEVVRSRPSRQPFTIAASGERQRTTRANLKIQEGCDFMCSFCIIPFARGRARSRELADILLEARQLLDAGHRELVLTGVNIGTWRHDGQDFLGLVRALLDLRGLDRLRISSIEPTTVSRELVDLMADHETLCPHLHIPLQSGSDRILELMKRQHTRRDFLELVEYAAAKVPDLLLATDLMVGFPGETDADFADSRSIFTDTPVAYAHLFRYSGREGTAAMRLPDTIDPRVKKARSAELHELSARSKQQRYADAVGREVCVLLEETDRDGRWTGFADNYIRVAIADGDTTNLAENQLVTARITDAPDDRAVRATLV